MSGNHGNEKTKTNRFKVGFGGAGGGVWGGAGDGGGAGGGRGGGIYKFPYKPKP